MDEKRRDDRVAVTGQLTVSLCLADQGTVIAGPVTAMIRDISSRGVCLKLKQVALGRHHLFYAPQDNRQLVVGLHLPGGEGNDSILPAMPVWFNKEFDEQPNYYLLGLEFQAGTDDSRVRQLIRMTKGGRGKSGFADWLKDLI